MRVPSDPNDLRLPNGTHGTQLAREHHYIAQRSIMWPMSNGPFQPTPEARYYALEQLSRRAGVQGEFFRSWRVEHRIHETVVFTGEETRKYIRFRHADQDFWPKLAREPIQVVRASWTDPVPLFLTKLVPDLIVPFANRSIAGPLFVFRGTDEVECSVDVLASVLLSLTRFEETLPGERDVHGRFPSWQSLAQKFGFLNRPVVDELGLAFEYALKRLLPCWMPVPRTLRVKLTHDVDDVGIPFRPRSSLALLARRRPKAAIRDLFTLVSDLRPSALDSVLRIVKMSQQYGLDSAVYWMSSPRAPFDSGYDLGHPMIMEVISKLREAGIEAGVHPGYYTYLEPSRLAAEIAALRQILGQRHLGGRQHFLRWSPETWLDWETCGLAYDSTLGYADHVGFRAGTCFPYRPWLLGLNRKSALIEVPLIVMDRSLTAYMGLRHDLCYGPIADCIARCDLVGGVFTLLWHNVSLLDPSLEITYNKVLTTLAGRQKFDWLEALTDNYI